MNPTLYYDTKLTNFLIKIIIKSKNEASVSETLVLFN